MLFSRFLVRSSAVGAFLVVLFVQFFGDARSNFEKISLFAANVAQDADRNADADFNRNAENVESAVDKNSDGFSDSNGSLWFRLDRDSRGVPTRLSTSIVRFQGQFQGNDGKTRDVSVDLIGAIHIAEKDYFNELNRSFQEYEIVVFEMVLPKGADPRAALADERNKKAKISGSPLNAISFLQQTTGDALGLVYQINGIDYSPKNFRRGDANAEDFLLKVLTNGDVPNFFVDAFLNSLLDFSAGETEGWALVYALANDKQTALKRLFAVQLIASELKSNDEPTAENIAEILENPSKKDAAPLKKEERENALIHYRNKIAFDVARQELAAGRTKIAIFYGAAHLPDLQSRLENELGLKRGEPRWIPAWKMESPKKEREKTEK